MYMPISRNAPGSFGAPTLSSRAQANIMHIYIYTYDVFKII